MDTAAAGDDHRTFSFYQTFWPFLGIAEGDASASHQVEVVFQLSRNVEVVHRRRNNNHIVRLQFSDQFVGQRQRFLLTRRQRRIARTQGANQLAVQYRDRICSQVAHGNNVLRVFFTPLFNKIVGQLTRLRVPCQNTGFEN